MTQQKAQTTSPQRSSSSPPPAMIRLRLDVAYDGTDFHGWARQPGLRTVQAEIEQALATVLRLPQIPLATCAGRTDAGVHATGQVVHVDIPTQSIDALVDADVHHLARRLNRFLPDDLVITGSIIAAAGFDARFSALSRQYVYLIHDGQEPLSPLLRRTVLSYGHAVEVELMQQAAQRVIGTHDFAGFCRQREGATTIRTILTADWQRQSDGIARLELSADAFCHSMVRSLVGAMLAVGEGRWSLERFTDQLSAVDRAGITVVRPHGLVLQSVTYPPDNDLAARAEQTRARRTINELRSP